MSGDVSTRATAATGVWSTGSSPTRARPPCQDLLERVTRGSRKQGSRQARFYGQIGLDQPEAYAYAIEVMAAASQLPDAQEDMHAFLEKRKPKFDR